MAKIFVRERVKVGEGEKKPRFAVIAVQGADLKIYAKHIRKQEIEAIAKEVGAELIYLTIDKTEDDIDDEFVEE